jgi:hypothetical protein
MNSKKLSLRGSVLSLLLLFGLSCISDVAAQYRTRTTPTPESDRLVISESVTLSEQVSRFGGKFYPYTNLYTNWSIGLNLPKSSYSFSFGAGAHFSDRGKQCLPGSTTPGVPGTPRCGSGIQADIYTTVLNAFDFASVHRLSSKWNLSITDSFFSYPNIQTRGGYGDLLRFNSGVNGQVSNLGSLKNFKISPFGAASPKRSETNPGALAVASPLSPGGYGYYPGVGGYYGGYYPIFAGSLTNDFATTLDYQMSSKSTLDFTYDNSYLNYKNFGAFKSQSLSTQYSRQYSRKGTYYVSYSISRYAFRDPQETRAPAVPMPPEETKLEKVRLINRMGVHPLASVSGDPKPEEEPASERPYKPGFIHTISVGTSYQLTPDILLDFSVGPSVSTSNQGNTLYLNFSTMVSITKNFKKASVEADYFRYVGSGFGFGTVALTQGANLSFHRPLLKRVDLNLSATYFHFNDIFGDLTGSDCDSQSSNNCPPPVVGRPRIPNISGVILTSNLGFRITKRLNTNLGFNYFYVNRPERTNPFLFGYLPYNGGNFYFPIVFDYPLGHNLSAFVSYSYMTAGLTTSQLASGHSVAVGITHSNPSIFKIGRRK